MACEVDPYVRTHELRYCHLTPVCRLFGRESCWGRISGGANTPVLVEAISVVVRRDAIERSYRGGWPGFVSAVPNKTLCMDAYLARVGFMNPIDVNGFLTTLAGSGLTIFDGTGSCVDLVVIDQRSGPTARCHWIEFFRVPFEAGAVGAARLKGDRGNKLACPEGWSYESPLSRTAEFFPGVEPGANHEFLGTENGLDVYRERTSGREVYIGRTTPP